MFISENKHALDNSFRLEPIRTYFSARQLSNLIERQSRFTFGRIKMKSSGFTLLELLVTLTIISILVATSIPFYKDYRAQAYDFRALNDLRMVALAQEAHFLEKESYYPCDSTSCATLPGISKLSRGVEITIEGDENSFRGTASHPLGTGKKFVWDSKLGGLQEERVES
jgi:prepilin-type N-terminal cleavage/methylation domain-containing protein